MSDCYASNDEDGLAVCAAHRWSMAGVAPGGLCIEGRLIKAEAANQRLEAEVVNLSEEVVLAKVAIARVREVIDSADNNGEWPGMLVRVSAVRKALEGDSNE